MTATPITPVMSTDPSTTTTRIENPQTLLLIRLGWMFLAVLAIGIFLVAVPKEIETLRDSPRWAVGYQSVLAQIGMSRDFFAVFLTMMEILPISAAGILALVIFRLRSDDWMALFVSLSLIFLAIAAPLPIFQLDANLGAVITAVGGYSFLMILYLFPDGRFVPRWSMWLIIASIPVVIAFVPIRAAGHAGRELPSYSLFVTLALFLLFGIAIVAQIYRYTRVSTLSQIQQSKWVILGVLINFFILIIYALVPLIFPETAYPGPFIEHSVYSLASLIWMFIAVPAVLLSVVIIPLSIGVSIIRYRLWDVDLAINRSLVYGAVTIVLVIAFALTFLVLQNLLTGANPVAALAISAILPIVLFNPARKQAQHLVDRYLYRLRFDLNELNAAQKLPDIKNPGALSGRKLGMYDVLDVIGKGGMGEVYKGQGNGQIVALKILPDDLAKQEDFRKRFEREAQTLTALNHPHIVKIYGSGTTDNIAYMAMEYIEGQELGEKLKQEGKLSVDDIRDIYKGLCAALDDAHSQGFVHRDIKPSNVMLRKSADNETWSAVLMDFGVAKIRDARTGLTSTGAIGTIEYMAPEQIMAAKEVDKRADIYALGVMLYEMLVGERPFKGSPAQVMFAHLQQPPPDPRDSVSDVPRDVAHTVMKALAKNPEDRFASAGELMTAIRD